MSKLINIYSYLREHYQDFDISHDIAPKYIQILTGRDDNSKIVFIHVGFLFKLLF